MMSVAVRGADLLYAVMYKRKTKIMEKLKFSTQSVFFIAIFVRNYG